MLVVLLVMKDRIFFVDQRLTSFEQNCLPLVLEVEHF